MECGTHTSPTRRLRALVLDDDPAALRAVRRALESRRFSVLSAPDGVAGLDVLLDELLYLDVLVVDLDLPGRDARALADLVRRAGGERDLALVVLADGLTPQASVGLLALGVDAVVERSAGGEAVAAAAEAAVAARAAWGRAAPPAAARAQAARDEDVSLWTPFGRLALPAA